MSEAVTERQYQRGCLWRLPRVMEVTGFTRPSIYRLIKEGKFPKQIKIGSRAIAWKSSTIIDWIENLQEVA